MADDGGVVRARLTQTRVGRPRAACASARFIFALCFIGNPDATDAGISGLEDALGLNDYGDVVGHSDCCAFLWTAEWGFVDLGTLPGLPLCQTVAVNNRRQVVGWCWGGPVNGTRAVLWTAQGGMRDIGDGAAFGHQRSS